MKTIIVSVKPNGAEQIMNGKKPREVRKFYIEPPFKVVNYITQGDSLVYSEDYEDVAWNKPYIDKENNRVWTTYKDAISKKLCKDRAWNGKVAFEYIVNKVDRYEYDKEKIMGEGYFGLYYDELKKACLTFDEALVYGNKKDLYGFHISDLKIYDKPKEVNQFYKEFEIDFDGFIKCGENICPHIKENWRPKCTTAECPSLREKYKITRPPQNFVYIEEIRCCQSEGKK